MVHVEDAAHMLTALVTRDNVPSPVYHSPAENWRAADLKRVIEDLDGYVTIELDPGGQRAAPPAADGERFSRDFGWRAPPLAARLAAAAGRTC
jgi:hypothetical protein